MTTLRSKPPPNPGLADVIDSFGTRAAAAEPEPAATAEGVLAAFPLAIAAAAADDEPAPSEARPGELKGAKEEGERAPDECILEGGLPARGRPYEPSPDTVAERMSVIPLLLFDTLLLAGEKISGKGESTGRAAAASGGEVLVSAGPAAISPAMTSRSVSDADRV